MKDFNITLANLRHITCALRKFVNPAYQPTNENTITEEGMTEAYCMVMRQMYGKKLKELSPFQRDPDYIKHEIAYEEEVGEEKRLQCQAEIKIDESGLNITYVLCNKPCRMKYCTACWKERLAEIHGQPGHCCNVKLKPDQEPFIKEMD
jgi:hypothetical protein